MLSAYNFKPNRHQGDFSDINQSVEIRSYNTKDSMTLERAANAGGNQTESRNGEETFNDGGTYGAVNETVGSAVGSLASAATSSAARTLANGNSGP